VEADLLVSEFVAGAGFDSLTEVAEGVVVDVGDGSAAVADEVVVGMLDGGGVDRGELLEDVSAMSSALRCRSGRSVMTSQTACRWRVMRLPVARMLVIGRGYEDSERGHRETAQPSADDLETITLNNGANRAVPLYDRICAPSPCACPEELSSEGLGEFG
jgi:hypothetical protein